MSDELGPVEQKRRRREFPIVAGVIALAAMVLVVGGIVGGGALLATRAAGLDGTQDLDSSATEKATLYAPEPTGRQGGSLDPGVTLSPTPEPTSEPAKPEPTKKPKPEPLISLSAVQTAVAPMERIDLSGTYNAGEGAVLRIQQFEAGAWSDFPVTVAVTGGSFSTYIQASAVGLNRFRVLDTDTGEASNEIRVQIG